MSTYHIVAGVLRFDERDEFNAAVKAFEQAGLLTDDGWFRTEPNCGQSPPDTPDIDEDELVIEVPSKWYCDFFATEEETLGRASEYGIVWATDDGADEAGIQTHTREEVVDLGDWALEHSHDDNTPDTIAFVDAHTSVLSDVRGEA